MTTAIERTIDKQLGAPAGDTSETSPKVTVAASDLRRAVTAIARILPSKTALPVIADIRLLASAVTDDSVTLTATDLVTAATVSIPATVHRPGAAMLDGPRIAGLVGRLDGEVVIDHRGSQVALTAGSVRTNLNSLPARDYPSLPGSDGARTIVVTARDLRLALDQVVIAVARSGGGRPQLEAVYLRATEGTIRLATCDGFRLVLTELDGRGDDLDLLVAGPAARHLRALLPADGTEVTFAALPGGKLSATWGDTTWFGRTVDGTYPDVAQIVPRSSRLDVGVDRDEALAALAIAQPFAAGNNDVVKVSITADGLTVSASSADAGDVRTDVAATTRVADAHAGTGGQPSDVMTGSFAVNAGYLKDHLSVTAGRVHIGYSDPGHAVVLRSDDRPETTHVVMPMVPTS